MSEDNVIAFPGQTFNELQPEMVLEAAKETKLDCVLILGISPEGGTYSASSTGDVPEILFMLERFKHHLLAGDYSE